jgi:hypothetical protein
VPTDDEDFSTCGAAHWSTLVRVGLAVGAAALVVAAGVVLPRLLGGGDRGPAPATRGDELALHGGPCPAVLPAPTDDDENGFGTKARATQAPSYAEPDSAWVCQYTARAVGRTSNGGTTFEWARLQEPRRLDGGELSRVGELLDGVEADTSDEGCSAELGPRWLLVTSTGSDLTGTAVDDFGCDEVRLSGDPFTSAPGDPQDDGTVAGVLAGPDALVTALRSWWDTSPADATAATAPDELHVTCTDQGPQVDTTTVAAQNGGVVLVVDSTLPRGSYLTYSSAGGGPKGGDPARATTTYAFPPGELTLSCAAPPGMDALGTATITVVDPHGYWRVETLESYGCHTSSSQPSWAVGAATGATAEAAVGHLLERFGADYTAQPSPTGYPGDETQTWVALQNGVPTLSIGVTHDPTGYTASPDLLCSR